MLHCLLLSHYLLHALLSNPYRPMWVRYEDYIEDDSRCTKNPTDLSV